MRGVEVGPSSPLVPKSAPTRAQSDQMFVLCRGGNVPCKKSGLDRHLRSERKIGRRQQFAGDTVARGGT